MLSSSWFTLMLSAAAAVNALPTQVLDARTPTTSWAASLKAYYKAVGAHMANIEKMPDFPSLQACDLRKAQMPTAPSPLPAPDSGLTLSHVAIGRGTQNYTCATSTNASIPASVGAVANLYNASCLAANYADVLALLPSVVLDLPIPTNTNVLAPANAELSGHHFFVDATTPTFNMDTAAHDYGVIYSAKNSSTAAPTSAPKGPTNADGVATGYGSVAWLKLEAKKGLGSKPFREVYRVNTAGGSPPPTCDGLAATFQVQYAAEYWLYD
ncbi:MAG: hypothetical protein M1819_005274 [Sarea resinae]|nr:MAG: hypothetical protein M1819_005274 [Sarea resinae]